MLVRALSYQSAETLLCLFMALLALRYHPQNENETNTSHHAQTNTKQTKQTETTKRHGRFVLNA